MTGAPSGKYRALHEALATAGSGTVEYRFNEIEQLVGPLPRSARKHKMWWGNYGSNPPSQARAWLGAGRVVQAVDLVAEYVRFSPPGWIPDR